MLLQLLQIYFRDHEHQNTQSYSGGGNAVQDLLLIGFSEYMGALSRHLYTQFLTDPEFYFRQLPTESLAYRQRADAAMKVRVGSAFQGAAAEGGGSMGWGGRRISRSCVAVSSQAVHDAYEAITDRYGRLQQVERWRNSLSLQPLSRRDICRVRCLLSCCAPVGPERRPRVDAGFGG